MQDKLTHHKTTYGHIRPDGATNDHENYRRSDRAGITLYITLSSDRAMNDEKGHNRQHEAL